MATTEYIRWGRSIVDSESRLTVRVREPDIKGAVCRDHQRCVIANAIKRQTRASFVDVGVSTVVIGKGKDTAIRFKLDSLGKQVVRYFDKNAAKAAPTNIVLLPPSASCLIGARKGEKQGSGVRSGKRRKPTR